jgi:hypothetical protein
MHQPSPQETRPAVAVAKADKLVPEANILVDHSRRSTRKNTTANA